MLKLQKLLQDQRHRAYYIGVLDRLTDFESPFKGRPYSCLLWATHPVAVTERTNLANALVASECRLACCGGIEVGNWEHAIDLASIAHQEAGYVERFVPTTTHHSEADATYYFVWCGDIDDHLSAKHLILVIGHDDAVITRLIEQIKKEVHARDVDEPHNTSAI